MWTAGMRDGGRVFVGVTAKGGTLEGDNGVR
jgi:hypothetical protein